ncbi:MAG: hypothetical protein AMXMBFR84_08940 [Candidatus Hydrogenedentota bacterium]
MSPRRYFPGSFRVRIAVLSTLLSGIVLLAFGTWGWSIARKMSTDRLDATIRELASAHLSRRQAPDYWQTMAETLAFALGGGRDDSILLAVRDRSTQLLYATPNWPDGLDQGTLPPPIEGDGPLPPFGQEMQGPPMGPPQGPPQGPFPPQPRGGQNGFPPFPGPNGFQPVPPIQATGQPAPVYNAPQDAATPNDGDGIPPEQGRRNGRGPGMGPRQGQGQGFGPGPGWGRGPGPRRPGDPPPPPLPVEVRQFFPIETGGEHWRVGVFSNPEVTIALGLNMAPAMAEATRLRDTYLIAMPLALLLIAAGGWAVSGRALKPVKTLTAAAQGITAQGLDQRIPAERTDAEFETLIQVFNEMMQRLDRSFQQATRFSADAAHELKTPLTILQGHLENALGNAEAGSKQQQTYSLLLEEVQRLKSIIRKLLLLSLADAGQLRVHAQPVDMSDLLEGVCDDIEIMAPKLSLQKTIPTGITISGDAELIRQVVQNLMSNAVKYNRKHGKIGVKLESNGTHTMLSVANTGPGIAEEDRPHIFDRFYRGDKARTRRVGAGLGLSLAREIARAHNGDLLLIESKEDRTVFQLTLPTSQG